MTLRDIAKKARPELQHDRSFLEHQAAQHEDHMIEDAMEVLEKVSKCFAKVVLRFLTFF